MDEKLQADIRNKLSPIKNLSTILKALLPITDDWGLNKIIDENIEEVDKSIEYLSNMINTGV